MVRYAFLRDALIRRLFLVDTLSNIEAALINFFVLLKHSGSCGCTAIDIRSKQLD